MEVLAEALGLYMEELVEIQGRIRNQTRKDAGQKSSTILGLIDSQSVKTSCSGTMCRGVDGGKMTKGRMRHIIVDTLGLLMGIVIHEANLHDSKGAPFVLSELAYRFPRLVKIIAEAAIGGG